MSKIIELSKGQHAIVDDEDFEFLNQWKWCAWSGQDSKNAKIRYYAMRNERIGARIENKFNCIRMHRLILKAKKGEIVDHINGNTLDNRKTNLRKTDHLGNARNASVRVNKKGSCFKGVKKGYKTKKGEQRYQAYINTVQIDGIQKRQYLGNFSSEVKAAITYDRAALKYFGDFARTNFKYQDSQGTRFMKLKVKT